MKDTLTTHLYRVVSPLISFWPFERICRIVWTLNTDRHDAFPSGAYSEAKWLVAIHEIAQTFLDMWKPFLICFEKAKESFVNLYYAGSKCTSLLSHPFLFCYSLCSHALSHSFTLFHTLSRSFSLFPALSRSFTLFHTLSQFFTVFHTLSDSFRLFQTLSDSFPLFPFTLFPAFSFHALSRSFLSRSFLSRSFPLFPFTLFPALSRSFQLFPLTLFPDRKAHV